MSDVNAAAVPAPARLGVALGGGAAKGWAHIGVLRALADHGWHPGVIVGTSIGAAVGAALAADALGDLETWARSLRWRDVVGYLDVGFGGGLIKARRVLADFEALLPARNVEDFTLPYGAVATDLSTGREVWLTRGNVTTVVRASMSIPGLFAPSLVDGRWLVDGGLVNPVPISLCRALGADHVVAVDLQSRLLGRRLVNPAGAAPEPSADVEAQVTGDSVQGRALWQKLRERGDELVDAFEVNQGSAPSIYEVMANAVNIMQTRIGRSRVAGDPPEILVAPRLPDVGLLDFHRAEECIAEGYRAAQLALSHEPRMPPPAPPRRR